MESIEEPISNLRSVRLEKVTLNIAVGKSGEPLEKAKKVLSQITGRTPATRRAKKTVKDFGIRKGEPIAAIVTVRKEQASEILSRTLEAIGSKVKASSFDEFGNMSFGIKEHIEIPGTKYVPELGIFGTTVHVTLGRPGYRVRERSIRPARIGRAHYVGKEDALRFMQANFHLQVVS